MKKILLVFIIILPLVGCGKPQKFYLDDARYEISAITEISINEFKEFSDEKQSFMVYVYLPSCISCANFKKVLEEYIENHNVEIYALSINETSGTIIEKKVKYAPSLVLFKDGKFVDFLDSESNKDKEALTTVKGLSKWLDNHIYFK